MGVSILCILRVAGLLKKEQEQDSPRPVFLRSIYVFMGFGLLMTLVALGIEVSRYFMPANDGELTQLKQKLKDIGGDGYFSLDGYGNPKAMSIELDGKPYTLSEAFPDTSFGETQLNIVQRSGKYRAVKNNSGTEVTYGYFPEQELKGKLTSFFSFLIPAVTQPKEPTTSTNADVEALYMAGMAYTPSNIRQDVKPTQITDRSKANRRLVDFLSTQGFENDALREEAVKLLMQPRMLDKLSVEGHNQLIELLSENGVRVIPWRYYELAQVYLSRYHLNGEKDKTDEDKYKEFSKKYMQEYERRGWTEANHPGEFVYYQSAAEAERGR